MSATYTLLQPLNTPFLFTSPYLSKCFFPCLECVLTLQDSAQIYICELYLSLYISNNRCVFLWFFTLWTAYLPLLVLSHMKKKKKTRVNALKTNWTKMCLRQCYPCSHWFMKIKSSFSTHMILQNLEIYLYGDDHRLYLKKWTHTQIYMEDSEIIAVSSKE